MAMLKTLQEKVNPGHAALIVVDMQNDFCHSDGAMAKQGRDVTLAQEMAPWLVKFIGEARRHRLPIIFVRQINSDWSQSEVWLEHRMRVNPNRYTVPCQEGSWGADFYAGIPQAEDYVVTKHRYSAFIGTDLELVLRSRGIKTLIMTGVQTNACVESTARDGLMRDFYIVFTRDCTATESTASHEAALHNIETLFGVVTTSKEITRAWQEGQ